MSVETVQGRLFSYLETAHTAVSILGPDEPLTDSSLVTARQAVETFEDQITSRLLDVKARHEKAEPRISRSGAGHEQDAVLGAQIATIPVFSTIDRVD
jgi:hypothetical protein